MRWEAAMTLAAKLCIEAIFCGPTGSRTPTSSMPWTRSTAIL